MRFDRLSLRDIRKTSTFRLTLLIGSAASVGVLLLLIFIYGLTARELNQRSDHVLQMEAQRLSAIPASELPARIAQSVRENSSGLNYFGLFSAKNELLAGNLTIPYRGKLDHPDEIDQSPDFSQPIRVLAHRTPSGQTLLLGRDIRPLADFRRHMFYILLFGALLVIPLIFLSSLALSIGPLRRVGQLQRVARTIASGELGARMPIKGRGDELDLFATTVNQMVEAVEVTVAQVKSVTDAIAHDLRTPLTHVRNQLYRAGRQPDLDEEQAGRLDQAIGELDFVIDRFAALMRISELEASKRTAAFAPVALSQLAMATFDLYAPLAEDREINLTLDVARSTQILGDEKLLFEAVSNLLDNAIKFAPTGGHVVLAIGQSENDVFIEIRDNGPGVPEDQRQAILRRFDRGNASSQIPGSGLGLSIVSAIMHLHNFALAIDDASPGLIVRITAPAIQPHS